MKPIELELQWFGQYAQSQTVPFDQLDRRFLITGETGSGKTTLFDAMSYALYGEGLGSRKYGAGLRSQLAGVEDSTVVRFVFEIRGVRWQVERSPYRFVRYKRGGNPETDNYLTLKRLSGPGAPEVIAPGEIPHLLRDLLVLRVDDFAKILVLPQGQFQQFLEMKSVERAKLLKTLFPVDRHERVAQLAKDEAREVHAKIKENDAFQKEVKREFVAETFAAQDSALSLRVEQLRDIEGVRAQEAEQAKAALHTARTLASLVERRTGRSQARTQHLTGEPAHQTRVQQLAAGRRAAAALPAVDARARLLQEINGLQQQHGKDAGELVVAAQVRDALRPAHVELPIRDAAQQEAKGSIGKQKERLEALAALVKARGEAARLAGEETSATAKAAEGQGAVELAQAALAALDAVGEASRQAQGALQAGRDRVEGCRRFETDAKAVRVWTDTRSPALAKELEQEQRVLGEREQDLTRAEQTLTDAQHRVDADAALALAANLRPDEPCPVCGSTDHPQPRHRSGDEVRDDALALRKTADALVKSARTGHEVQGKLVATVQATRITEKTAAEAAANRLRDAGFQGPEAWQVALAAAMADLAPLDGAEQERQVALAGRPNRAQALEWARQTADQRRTAAEQAAQRRTVATTTLQGLGERLGPVADAAVETLATQQAIRQAETAFDTETQAILKLRNDMQQAEARVSTLAGQVDALAKQLQAKRNDLPTTQQAAEKALADAQFDTEQAARACALTAAVLDTLQRQVEQWTLELAQLDTQLADLEREIDGRPAPDLVTAQQLAEQCATVATQAAEDRLAVASEQDQLRAKDKRFRELEEERRLLVADSRGLLDLSQRLNGEIAPKIDFATWMLTWWLDRVLRAANSRLRTLSDSRYAFRLRTGQTDGRVCAGLDVDVLDTWSNRLRDVNALSGGEKFLASLSLALGLADVVQSLNGGVQLDTLFIDEGFGSLDAETLGRAMELIEALSEHRSVGLISHVEAMQREIPSQVRVTKSPAGSKVTVVRSAKA
jgi:exonuclease SbcC